MDTAKELVIKVAQSHEGFISNTAKMALGENTSEAFEDFLSGAKDIIISGINQSDRFMFWIGKELCNEILSYYKLPFDTVLTAEQLTQRIGDLKIPFISVNALGALKAGKSEHFIDGLTELRKDYPKQASDLLKDELTVLLKNHIEHESKS